jgi:O-antigen/teichoic acid export membrane protein
MRVAELRFDRSIAKKCLQFSMPLIPTAVSSGLSSLFERTMLQSYLNLEALGIYMLSLRFSQVVNGIHELTKYSWAPFFYKSIEQTDPEGSRNTGKMISFYLLPVFAAALCVILFTEGFVVVAGQKAYASIIEYAPILVLPAITSCLSVYYAPGILMSKRTIWSIVPVAVQFVALSALGVLLLPRFGVYGMVFAKLASIILAFAVHVTISKRLYPVWDPPWKFVPIYFAAVLIALGVHHGVQGKSIVLSCLISGIVFGGLLASCVFTAVRCSRDNPAGALATIVPKQVA